MPEYAKVRSLATWILGIAAGVARRQVAELPPRPDRLAVAPTALRRSPERTPIPMTAASRGARTAGFFVAIRGNAFLAHAVPHGAFAGAGAGAAVLVGADPLVCLAVFSAAGALGIAALERRARNDVTTALILVTMLGLGAYFLSRSSEYPAQTPHCCPVRC